MGSRGQRSASASAGGGSQEGMNFDEILVDGANRATWSGNGGSSAVEAFNKNVEEIKSSDLSEKDKSNAIKTQKQLTEKYLKTMQQNPNILVTGAGGYKKNPQKSTEKILKAQSEINNHMTTVRKKQKEISQGKKNESMTQIIKKAIENGDLKVVIDGETWVRKSTRSRTFTAV